MPSPLAHCSLVLVAAPWLQREAGHLSPVRRLGLGAAVLFALCAPDADFLLRAALPARPFADHGGAMHSLAAGVVFAGPFAAVTWLLTGGGVAVGRLWVVGCLCYWSHGLLDACTHGRGVMLLWPFSEERFGLPVPLFYGVRHSQPYAWRLHLITLANELGFLVLVWLVMRWLERRWRPRAAPVGPKNVGDEAHG